MKQARTTKEVRIWALMEQLRRRIASRLGEGEALSSPAVVALSQRLDRLVLATYRRR